MLYIRRIVGNSMLPKFPPGMLVVFVWSWRYRPGDVVILQHKGKEKIKRIKETEKKHVYVAGDNHLASTDSRHFGWVPKHIVKGKLLYATKPKK